MQTVQEHLLLFANPKRSFSKALGVRWVSNYISPSLGCRRAVLQLLQARYDPSPDLLFLAFFLGGGGGKKQEEPPKEQGLSLSVEPQQFLGKKGKCSKK